MEIRLTLQDHCIQTEARKAYERLVGEYFRKTGPGGNKTVLEAEIDALKRFLEYADFAFLRSHYPELSGGKPISVTLDIPETISAGCIGFGETIIQLDRTKEKR
ncbi:MAG: hypothetical protein ACOZF0_19795 [Thermodesulfobacteriota bacterium]